MKKCLLLCMLVYMHACAEMTSKRAGSEKVLIGDKQKSKVAKIQHHVVMWPSWEIQLAHFLSSCAIVTGLQQSTLLSHQFCIDPLPLLASNTPSSIYNESGGHLKQLMTGYATISDFLCLLCYYLTYCALFLASR